MTVSANNERFILGDGVFSIGNTPIAITRGGGVFEIAKEYRAVEHDGAYGEYVKGLVRLDRATPRLTMNALSILGGIDFQKMYANTRATKTGEVTTITGTFEITDSDFNEVSWKGFLDDGTPTKIVVKNAINLENFNWELADKGEVVHALNFVGCYDKGSKVQPFTIQFGQEAPQTLKSK